MTQKTTYTILFIAFELLALLFFATSIYLEVEQLKVDRATHDKIKGVAELILESNP
jgi:hypothetical protein